MTVTRNAKAGWHTVVPTALGKLTLVRGADGLRGLYFPRHWHRPDPATLGPCRDVGFAAAVAQLDEYLSGHRAAFDVELAPRGDGFQQRVWELVRQVPYGDTVTYGEVARRLGPDVTAQQVGAAVGRNPLCIVVPCHRIVGAGGTLTGYAGGLPRKQQLLDLERNGRPVCLQPDEPVAAR